MNVLFVYSLTRIGHSKQPLILQERMQFGIAYISAVVKQNGHDTHLVVLLSKDNKEENEAHLASAIVKFSPRVVCFGAVYTEFEFITQMASYVKKNWPFIKILIGGTHVTLDPESAVVRDVFDAICVGEGEYPVSEYIRALDDGRVPSGIANLWVRNGGNVERNPTRPFIQDLDSLPFPDRDIWQPWIEDQTHHRFAVLLGRGCPFLCSYCSNHALRKVADGSYVRFRSVGNVIEELKYLAGRYGSLKEIYFEIETIGFNKEWALDLCDQLERFNEGRLQPISFGVNLRVTPNNDLSLLFSAFKRANFRFVNIGVESGSNRVRQAILNRHYSNQDIIDVVRLARQHGLQVSFFNLIGLPGETENDFQETIEINRVCQPDWYSFSIFYPYPGTELYRYCIEKGIHLEPGGGFERRDIVLDLPSFPKDRIMHHYIWFDYNVRSGYQPKVKLLVHAFITFILYHSWVVVCYRFIARNSILKRWIDRIRSIESEAVRRYA
jgi:radical SAM superfamily enzyme YgiQ (UPF0313 family)